MIFSFQILVVKYGEISKWSSWEQSFNSLTQTQFIVFLYGRLGELRLRLNMQNDFNTIYTQTPHTHKMQGSNFWRLHFLSQNIKTLGRCMLLNFSCLKDCFALESESKSKLWCYLLCSVASQFSLKGGGGGSFLGDNPAKIFNSPVCIKKGHFLSYYGIK